MQTHLLFAVVFVLSAVVSGQAHAGDKPIEVNLKTFSGYVTTCDDSQATVVTKVISILGGISNPSTVVPSLTVTSLYDQMNVYVTKRSPPVTVELRELPSKHGICTLNGNTIDFVLIVTRMGMDFTKTFTLTDQGTAVVDGVTFSFSPGRDSLVINDGTRHVISSDWEGSNLHAWARKYAEGSNSALGSLQRYASHHRDALPDETRDALTDFAGLLPVMPKVLGILLAEASAIKPTTTIGANTLPGALAQK